MIKTMQIMRITHHITCALAGLLALASVLTGCKQEPVEKLAQAVLPSEQLLNFEAVSAPEQVINVYSDGSWMADVDQEWITVTPMSGKGPMEVTMLAKKYGKPVYAVAGCLGEGYEKCLEMGIVSIAELKDKDLETDLAVKSVRETSEGLLRRII